MVRLDIICGYLVPPEQLRVFANAQGIRYDPGGDLALLHSGVRRWAEGHKLPIPQLWEVQHPRLVSPTEGGPRILIPTRRRTAAHTFQFKEKYKDREMLRRVLEHPQLSVLGVDAVFVTCPDPVLQWTLPGEEYTTIFVSALAQRLKHGIECGFHSPPKMNHKLTGWTISLCCRDVFGGEADGK
jgi:hypothetical protein